jgi:hypothetical protein
MKMTRPQLTKHKQNLNHLLEKIHRHAYRCAFDDPLIKGTPGEVFRTCGKKTCKCMTSQDYKHGPYRVIQVYKAGKQRQVPLRKDQKAIWEQAQHYQKQMKYVSELKEMLIELENLVKEIIEQRIEEWP